MFQYLEISLHIIKKNQIIYSFFLFKDFCDPNPCLNGGSCIPSIWTNKRHLITCKCPPGYDGLRCEHKALDVCSLPMSPGKLVYSIKNYLHKKIWKKAPIRKGVGWRVNSKLVQVSTGNFPAIFQITQVSISLCIFYVFSYLTFYVNTNLQTISWQNHKLILVWVDCGFKSWSAKAIKLLIFSASLQCL
jgi:hypothetical protein